MTRLSEVAPDNSRPPFLSADDRAAPIANRAPFYLVGVHLNIAGKFGPVWVITCRSVAVDSDEWRLSFSSTEPRDNMFDAVQNELVLHPEHPIGPVILTEVKTRIGNKFLDLVDAE